MNQELIDKASAKIAEDFPARSDIGEACRSIVAFLSTQPEGNLRHLTFGMLSGATGRSTSSDLVSSAIAYLSGDRAGLLEMKFEFIDQGDIFPLPATELAKARREKIFYHPIAGVPVEDFEQHVYIYFVPFGTEQDDS